MRRRFMDKRDIDTGYFILDQTTTDPEMMIYEYGNDDMINYLRNNSFRCVGKFIDDHMYICRLNNNNSDYYYDGTIYQYTDGNIFMKPCPFYAKTVLVRSDVYEVNYNIKKIDDSYIPYFHDQLIGAYKATKEENVSTLSSLPHKTALVNTSKNKFRSLAKANGSKFHLVTWEQHCGMALLYYAYYKHTNSQLKVGKGVDKSNLTTGQTNSLGMTDTEGRISSSNGNKGPINFWGLENWWCNIYEWIDNINKIASGSGIEIKDPITNNTLRTISSYVSSGYGYMSKMSFAPPYFDLLANSLGGTENRGFCDYYSINYTDGFSALRAGTDLPNFGISSFNMVYDATQQQDSIGSRLAYTGPITEI